MDAQRLSMTGTGAGAGATRAHMAGLRTASGPASLAVGRRRFPGPALYGRPRSRRLPGRSPVGQRPPCSPAAPGSRSGPRRSPWSEALMTLRSSNRARLTPAYVHSMSFRLARLGRRGLDEDDVRDFCARVETELVHLLEERAALFAELRRLRGHPPGSTPAAAAPPRTGPSTPPVKPRRRGPSAPPSASRSVPRSARTAGPAPSGARRTRTGQLRAGRTFTGQAPAGAGGRAGRPSGTAPARTAGRDSSVKTTTPLMRPVSPTRWPMRPRGRTATCRTTISTATCGTPKPAGCTAASAVSFRWAGFPFCGLPFTETGISAASRSVARLLGQKRARCRETCT